MGVAVSPVFSDGVIHGSFPAAISFSVGFYLGMGEGETIEGALRDAAIVVMTEYPGSDSKIEVWKDGKKLQLSDLNDL